MSCTKFPLDFSPSFLHHFFFHLHSTFYPCLFSPTFRQISFVSPFWSRTENHSQRKSGVLRQTSLLCWPTPNPRSASRSVGIATRSTLLFLPVSLSLSASFTGSSCGANNIRSRRPEYWPISSFSISSPVTCSPDSRYHHDVTYEARNQQKVSVCQCFGRSRRGNNPWSLQSHTEPRRRSESSAGTMFATQTAMLTLAYFLNSDMGHKTIPRASYRLPTSLPNTLMLPASHSPPVISQMRTIRWQSDLFTDHSVFPLLPVLSFFPFLYIKPTKPTLSDTAAFVPDLSSEDLATLQSRRLALLTRPLRKLSARTRRLHLASLVRESTTLSLATSATRTLPRPKTTTLSSQDRNPGYSTRAWCEYRWPCHSYGTVAYPVQLYNPRTGSDSSNGRATAAS
jgi:hypothetical protein